MGCGGEGSSGRGGPLWPHEHCHGGPGSIVEHGCVGAHGGEGHYRDCVKMVGHEEVRGQDESHGGGRVGVRVGPGPDAVITGEEAWFWGRSLRRERKTVKVTPFVYDRVLRSCINNLHFSIIIVNNN